jgi:hypothetical protein
MNCSLSFNYSLVCFQWTQFFISIVQLNLALALVPLHQLVHPFHDHLVHQSSFPNLARVDVGHPLPFLHIPSFFHHRNMHHLNN